MTFRRFKKMVKGMGDTGWYRKELADLIPGHPDPRRVKKLVKKIKYIDAQKENVVNES